MARTIEVPDQITVGALADILEVPVTTLIGELFKGGVMVTVNEKIDFDTASILVGELGFDVELKAAAKTDNSAKKVAYKLSDKAVSRPPVVAVMGHVDHGKTSILDAIRASDTAAHEAGGITQHISAYQISHNGRLVTFLDTPGHEAFAALREHGAMLTDVVILVVAADDGIKPQTLEAIRFARKAGVKIVVAINKIDKEGANPALVKQQLAENDLLIEEWGGDTVAIEVSAKQKTGIDKLIDMVLLVADVEDLKADIDVPAQGLVIEAHMETGRGAIATALVQQGVLKKNLFIVSGSTYAKVKVLESTDGKAINEAGPSSPVQIVGFKQLPEFGDAFKVVKDEKTAKEIASKAKIKSATSLDMTSTELTRIMNRRSEVTELYIIVKADVQGSLTSLVDSIKTFDSDELNVNIIGSGVGSVTENDVRMAQTSGAIIYGFQVGISSSVRALAQREKIEVRLYRVIYELLDDIKEELTKLLSPEVIETELGRLVVKGVFKISKTEVICGGEVTKGKLQAPALARVKRDGEIIAKEVVVEALKQGPQETKEVQEGEMCGLSFKTESRVEVHEGDHIELFTREIKQRTL
ncbi:translation initiation factor IF-2 [Candidatus Saccharibacteria bacterium]|nr:translation initiation factor IF-2 [Candidatus Saccharibacteria bacterium]